MEDLKKCKRCDRHLPANNRYFFNNKNSEDGLYYICKECDDYEFRDMRSEFVPDAIGNKICRKCLKEYPMDLDHFSKDANTRDGYRNSCKVCQGYKFTYYLVEYGFRVCSKCESKKELNKQNFHIDNKNKQGFDPVCKDCKTAKNNDHFCIDNWYKNRSDKFKSNWRYEDIKWMYDNYPRVTKDELLEYFNGQRKYKSITNVIYQWNIRKIEKNDDWSEDDILFLQLNYPNMKQESLEKKFKNRTWHSIKLKASKLNIHRDQETKSRINSESQIGKTISEETKAKLRGRRGEKAWNWKGGVSPLHPYLRDKISEWKLDSLRKYDFKCAFTGTNDRTLQVHHVNKNFSEIIQETFSNLKLKINPSMENYSEEERISIEEEFKRLHYYYGLGVPLTAEIHRLFHSLYSNRNNTPEQFDEFKIRFEIGEFQEIKGGVCTEKL